ncbi:hypothetical protein T484DRAFT_1790459 [Baffinella frigidus]|nr:hypothetical protein T484DRAFT_1790459 [Cryptophyta sp. CCMP2293]
MDLKSLPLGAGLVTRLLELARDEDLGLNGDPGDLTCAVMLETTIALTAPTEADLSDKDLGLNADPGDLTCAVMLEEAQELEARIMSRAELVTSAEARIMSRAELVTSGLATLPEALKLFAPNVSISSDVARWLATLPEALKLFAPNVTISGVVPDGTKSWKVGNVTISGVVSDGTKALKLFAPNVNISGVVPDGTKALKLFASNVTISGVVPDGTKVPKGTPLATFKGPSSEMLRLERPVLNLVGRLSGIATRTAIFHEAMVAAAGADCRAKLLDTRKTTPGLRVLEKYAVGESE